VLPATLSVVVVRGMREGEVPLAGKRGPRIVTGGGVGGGGEVKREQMVDHIDLRRRVVWPG
jgi:hypothetical protein